MQACGMLAMRLASHTMAACSMMAPVGVGLAGVVQGRTVSTSVAAGGAAVSGQAILPSLSDAQRRQLPRLLSELQRPGAAAQRLGALTSLSVSYRDLSVLLTALQARDAGRDPLLEADPRVSASMAAAATELEQLGNLSSGVVPSSPASSSSSSFAAAAVAKPKRGTYLPLKDVTLIPEDKQVDGRSDAPEELRYNAMYMDKVSCWAATQPSHIEMSHQLMTGINLFPPNEAAYPTYVDFDAALRLLAHHRSRKRMRFQRRLMRKQDKYQLKTWAHHPGEA